MGMPKAYLTRRSLVIVSIPSDCDNSLRSEGLFSFCLPRLIDLLSHVRTCCQLWAKVPVVQEEQTARRVIKSQQRRKRVLRGPLSIVRHRSAYPPHRRTPRGDMWAARPPLPPGTSPKTNRRDRTLAPRQSEPDQ